MFEFTNDLARGGTAPAAITQSPKGRSRGSGLPKTAQPLRPTTRGFESNDLPELNTNLRLNKFNQFSGDSGNIDDGQSIKRDQTEYVQAVESFRAAIDDWSGARNCKGTSRRRDCAIVGTATTADEATDVPPFMGGKDNQRKEIRKVTGVINATFAPYTQNVPNIVLNSSRKLKQGLATSSPRPGRDLRGSSPIEPPLQTSKAGRSQVLSSVVAAYGAKPHKRKGSDSETVGNLCTPDADGTNAVRCGNKDPRSVSNHSNTRGSRFHPSLSGGLTNLVSNLLSPPYDEESCEGVADAEGVDDKVDHCKTQVLTRCSLNDRNFIFEEDATMNTRSVESRRSGGEIVVESIHTMEEHDTSDGANLDLHFDVDNYIHNVVKSSAETPLERPQSRKLYLGVSGPCSAVVETTRRGHSAGLVKSRDLTRLASNASTSSISSPWKDRTDLETSRPPSRQKSAFPVHLADVDDVGKNVMPSWVNKDSDIHKEFDRNAKCSSSSSGVAGLTIEVPSVDTRGQFPLSSTGQVKLQRPPSRQKIGAQHLFDQSDHFSSKRFPREDGGDESIPQTSQHKMQSVVGPNTSSHLSKNSSASRLQSMRNLEEAGEEVHWTTHVEFAHLSSPTTDERGGGKQALLPATAPAFATHGDERSGRLSATAGSFKPEKNDPVADGFLDVVGEDMPFKIVVNRVANSQRPLVGCALTKTMSIRSMDRSSNSPAFSDISDNDSDAMESTTPSCVMSVASEMGVHVAAGSAPSLNTQFKRGMIASPVPGNPNGSSRGTRALAIARDKNSTAHGCAWPMTPKSPTSQPVSHYVRPLGGWVSQNQGEYDNSLIVNRDDVNASSMPSPDPQMASSSSWVELPDIDDGLLTEASFADFADLERDLSLTSFTLESSLDQDFLSLFAPGL